MKNAANLWWKRKLNINLRRKKINLRIKKNPRFKTSQPSWFSIPKHNGKNFNCMKLIIIVLNVTDDF